MFWQAFRPEPVGMPGLYGGLKIGGETISEQNSRREKFNIASHLLGAALASLGTAVLIVPPLRAGEPLKALTLAIFGLTLILSYLISTLFHGTTGETRILFRRLDRAAIYLLIIGGYTPICLLALPPLWGWPLLTLATTVALLGVFLELRSCKVNPPHHVIIYLALGWMAIIAIKPLVTSLTWPGFGLLVAGGLLYSIGALVVRYRPVPWSHEFWHVAVLAASACHFMMVYRYIH